MRPRNAARGGPSGHRVDGAAEPRRRGHARLLARQRWRSAGRGVRGDRRGQARGRVAFAAERLVAWSAGCSRAHEARRRDPRWSARRCRATAARARAAGLRRRWIHRRWRGGARVRVGERGAVGARGCFAVGRGQRSGPARDCGRSAVRSGAPIDAHRSHRPRAAASRVRAARARGSPDVDVPARVRRGGAVRRDAGDRSGVRRRCRARGHSGRRAAELPRRRHRARRRQLARIRAADRALDGVRHCARGVGLHGARRVLARSLAAQVRAHRQELRAARELVRVRDPRHPREPHPVRRTRSHRDDRRCAADVVLRAVAGLRRSARRVLRAQDCGARVVRDVPDRPDRRGDRLSAIAQDGAARRPFAARDGDADVPASEPSRDWPTGWLVGASVLAGCGLRDPRRDDRGVGAQLVPAR